MLDFPGAVDLSLGRGSGRPFIASYRYDVSEVVALDDAGHWVTEDRPEADRDRLEVLLTE